MTPPWKDHFASNSHFPIGETFFVLLEFDLFVGRVDGKHIDANSVEVSRIFATQDAIVFGTISSDGV